jgi:antitoxin (DNA-binding transcriptional repressor) of toxin-antitoxin stability system
MRHKKPIAQIIPKGRRNLDEVRDAVAGLRELRAKIATRLGRKAKLSRTQIKSLISGRTTVNELPFLDQV